MKKNNVYVKVLVSAVLLLSSAVQADNTAELAKKLANPIANLISLPIQVNYNNNFNPKESGDQWLTNVQPVIPISLNDDWLVISRTIIPVVKQTNIPIQGSNESGLGDIQQQTFVSPKKLFDGWMWGVGAVVVADSASDKTLGSGKWSAGPTGVALKQEGPWTYGILSNYLSSFAGDSDRTYVSNLYIQPFLAYITSTYTTITVNTESSYNFNTSSGSRWSTPINLDVYQMFKIGKHVIQAGGGVKYYAKSFENGADGWGARFQLTFLFPDK